MADAPGLLERLAAGPVICAEGYLFELERRGYLQAGAFVPEVVLEHPEMVSRAPPRVRPRRARTSSRRSPTTPTARSCGSSAASTCSSDQPPGARARPGVARDTGTLLAGTSATRTSTPATASRDTVRGMFAEQVGWAADAGVDFVIGETFSWAGEALVATEVIKAAGLPAVVTLAPHSDPDTRDGWASADACRGSRRPAPTSSASTASAGPTTMMPLLEEVRAAVSVHVAALPVPYRTHAAEPSMQSLRDPLAPRHRAFPIGLDPFTCTRYEITRFTADALALGVTTSASAAAPRPPHPGDGRGDRPHAAREPVLGRHVQARVPRHRPDAEDRVPGLRAAPLIGAVDVPPMMRG